MFLLLYILLYIHNFGVNNESMIFIYQSIYTHNRCRTCLTEGKLKCNIQGFIDVVKKRKILYYYSYLYNEYQYHFLIVVFCNYIMLSFNFIYEENSISVLKTSKCTMLNFSTLFVSERASTTRWVTGNRHKCLSEWGLAANKQS